MARRWVELMKRGSGLTILEIPHQTQLNPGRQLKAGSTRVIVSLSNPIMADGLKFLLAREFTVLDVAQPDGLIDAAERLRPNLIVTDIPVPFPDEFDVIVELLRRRPESRVVVTAWSADRSLAARAFRVGVFGYLKLDGPTEDLLTAVRDVAAGRLYLAKSVAPDIVTLLMGPARASGS